MRELTVGEMKNVSGGDYRSSAPGQLSFEPLSDGDTMENFFARGVIPLFLCRSRGRGLCFDCKW